MGSPRAYPGGIRLSNEGERLGYEDLNRLATMSFRSLMHLLSEVLYNREEGNPCEGVLNDGLVVTSSGGLNYSVARGYAFHYDSAETDDWESHYQVVCLSAASAGTHVAHEANPRWDIISVAPATVDDESETDSVRDPATGTVTSTTINTRRAWSATVTVTKGTAAAVPAIPATPSGHIKIAEVWVPATSGDVVVYDVRPRVFLGQDVARGLAGDGAASDCVLGSGDELLVEADGGGMYVFVDAGNEGEVMYGGYRYHGPSCRKSISAAHATLDRIDVVEAHYEGYLSVIAGTPASPPVAPAPSGDGVVLAEVYVTAGATVILAPNVTDRRVREPIGEAQIQDDEVTQRKIAVKFIVPDISVGAESSDVISVAIQMRDASGNAYADTVRCRARILNPSGSPVDDASSHELTITTGTTALPTYPPVIANYGTMVFDTNAAGEAAFDIEDIVGGQGGHWLLIEPLNQPGTPTIADLPFDNT